MYVTMSWSPKCSWRAAVTLAGSSGARVPSSTVSPKCVSTRISSHVSLSMNDWSVLAPPSMMSDCTPWAYKLSRFNGCCLSITSRLGLGPCHSLTFSCGCSRSSVMRPTRMASSSAHCREGAGDAQGAEAVVHEAVARLGPLQYHVGTVFAVEGEETPVQCLAFFFQHTDSDVNACLAELADAASLHLSKLIDAADNHAGMPFLMMRSAQGGVFP